jgi:hypothetical protein
MLKCGGSLIGFGVRAGTCSGFLRIDRYEPIPIRQPDPWQSLSVHLVAWANNSIQIQDVRSNRIYLLVG